MKKKAKRGRYRIKKEKKDVCGGNDDEAARGALGCTQQQAATVQRRLARRPHAAKICGRGAARLPCTVEPAAGDPGDAAGHAGNMQ